MVDDRVIQEMVEAAVAGLPAPNLRIRVGHGVVQLSGTVLSEADRRRAESMAASVEGVRSVQNDLVVNLVAGNLRMPWQADEDYAVETEDFDEMAMGESPEPDLNQLAGTTDPLQPEAEGDEPYFPPTDPVIEPLGREEGGYRVLGGYSESAMDTPLAADPAPHRMDRSDEQIADNVRLALKEDAATTDLDIHIHVRNGVVYLHGKVRYLADVDATEEVAGRVDGVREVREQLQLE